MLTLVSLLDLDPIPNPTLILVPINLETELPIDSHIPLLEKNVNFYNTPPRLTGYGSTIVMYIHQV